MIKEVASFETKSSASRVRISWVCSEFLRSSKIARDVSEFFERSPRMRPQSDSSRQLLNSGERLNEPDSVLSQKTRFSRGGKFFFKLSGKTFFTDFRNG